MKMNKKELRTFNITNLEKRSGEETEPIKISGYAAVFNTRATIGGWFDEIIKPGAFAKSLADNSDVRALFNHNWDKVLGRTKSGTLRLSEDERGLKFEIDLPNTTAAKDLAESMDRGDINQCSFSFFATEETWDYSVEPALRTVQEVELYEVSVVSIPSYEEAEAALVRSKEMGREVERRGEIVKKINNILEEN